MKLFGLRYLKWITFVVLAFVVAQNTLAAARITRLTPAGSSSVPAHTQPTPVIHASVNLTMYIYLPLVTRADVCQPTGETYGTLAPNGPMPPGVAETHPDINLAVRGYQLTSAYLGLVDYAGQIDPAAPQLPSLFTDDRTAVFSQAYKVYRWDWNCNCRSGPITKWDVTVAGLATTSGEVIHLPVAGYDVGGGYGALVLYASTNRITLKYMRDDDVIGGYTIHLENVCVDPNLLALYGAMDAAGRAELPALRPGQPLGRAMASEIGVAVRDSGSFLDPRSRKDWWQGR